MVLCSVIIALAIEEIFKYDTAPVLLGLWPPLGFYRALLIANRYSFDYTRLPIKTADLFSRNEFSNSLLFLFFMIFVYFFLAFYLSETLPSEFGIKKPWYFPVAWLIPKSRKESISPAGSRIFDETALQMEDADVKKERERVLDSKFNPSLYPLVMKNMRKVYAGRGGLGPKVAVKDVTFAVEEGVTFGLLGPNGKNNVFHFLI